ncbi:GNAT family N-acetyltransferase [Yimella sp. cx-573]|nr:GNAT family N-acetyltransferase [Yimella sp. cx-573]
MHIPSETEARAALEALPGLNWQPFGRDDLPDIAAFYAVCEEHDNNPERSSLTGLQEFWDSPRSRPEHDTLVARDETGTVVATAWAGCNRAVTEKRGVYLGGAVHPAHRDRGIGRAVLNWQMAHGNSWDQQTREDRFGPLDMRLYAPVDQEDVRDLAQRAGLEVERYFFEMRRMADGTEVWPSVEGIDIVDWNPARSAEAMSVVNESFKDHWGFTPMTREMWDEGISADTFRPHWTLLAVERTTDRVVGVVINSAYEQDWAAEGVTEGYSDDLGVLRSHRGRGIASALLRASMVRFAEAGLEAAALGVDADNPSGALRLYEGLGFERTASTCVHRYVASTD